jgi:hypothetical protein
MMNKMLRFSLKILLPVFFLGGSGAIQATAQEGAATSKAEQKVLLDNDKVKVVENRYPPGSEGESTARTYRIARAIKGGTLVRIYADGKKETLEWKTGDVKEYDASAPFMLRNVGKTEVIIYVVNLKK